MPDFESLTQEFGSHAGPADHAGVTAPEIAGPGPNGAKGELRASFVRTGRRTGVARAYEAGGLRLRFPKVQPGLTPDCEAVCINTGGGMVGGDTAHLRFDVGPAANVTITTQSAEKIYRSNGGTTAMDVGLRLGAGARAEWLPQETILFDNVRFTRKLDIDLAADASLLLAESLVFGRIAMGETLRTGSLRDQWRVRRDGRLLFAEALRLEGDIARQLERPALGAGARAAATLLLVAPNAPEQLTAVREILSASDCPGGASCLDGLLIVRLLSASPESVRAAIVRLLAAVRGRAAPRVWQ